MKYAIHLCDTQLELRDPDNSMVVTRGEGGGWVVKSKRGQIDGGEG